MTPGFAGRFYKTAAIAATGYTGDSLLFLLDYLLRFLRVALLLSLWRILLQDQGVAGGMHLLDEPTLGLDVLARRDVLRFIRDLNREQRVTVMVTSHDMGDLEQLAGRILMIHQGRIAFDGDFDRLRREFGDRRRLLVETEAGAAPRLQEAALVSSEDGRHEYVFDAARVSIPELLSQVSAQARVLDVETGRAPIDDVIADVYERWQK